jgi:hypothetical protein
MPPPLFKNFKQAQTHFHKYNAVFEGVVLSKDLNEAPQKLCPSINNRIRWICGCGEVRIEPLRMIRERCGDGPFICNKCSNPGFWSTYQQFVDILSESGYTMVSERKEYKNAKSLMWVSCEKGHAAYKTSRNRFVAEHRCRECAKCIQRKHTIETVSEEFKTKGFILLESNYVNTHTLMRYICKCGREGTIEYSNFTKNTSGCRECTRRRTYDDVEELFEDRGCLLIAAKTPDGRPEFILNATRVYYRCICGDYHFSSFKMFNLGARCPKCTDEKRRKTCERIYGYYNPAMSDVVKERVRATERRKYGKDHHMQVPEILAKAQASAYRPKEYTFPSGVTRLVQGYENYAIDELLKTTREDEIRIGVIDVPSIRYPAIDKERTYFPDIYIPSRNLLVEVKSSYTLEVDLDKNKRKFRASSKEGYNIEVWVYDKKGRRTDIYEYKAIGDCLFIYHSPTK